MILVGLGCFIRGLRSDFFDDKPKLSMFVFVLILLVIFVPKTNVVWEVVMIFNMLLTGLIALALASTSNE